jgi:CRISPR-associated endonuclease/helicase Cas3
MSTTTLNAGRKTLASQLDRLDTIIDSLADNLHDAVAMATANVVKETLTVVVQEAVRGALVEILANAELQKRLSSQTVSVQPSVPLMVRLAAKARSCWSWLKSTVKGACSKVKQMVSSLSAVAAAKVQQARRQVVQRAKMCWMWTVALAALAKRFRLQLGVAVGVGVLVGAVCYLGGREIASVGCGLAGFVGSLASDTVSRLRRRLAQWLPCTSIARASRWWPLSARRTPMLFKLPPRLASKGLLMTAPLAHSANPQGKTHDLARHLYDTAQLVADFASAFDSAGFGRCAGLWHDLGKNALDVQARLAQSADAHIEGGPGSGRVDHSSAGALYALDTLKAGLGLPLSFVIAGHHAGLADKVDLDNRLAGKRDRLQAALANPAKVVPPAERPVPPSFLQAAPGVSAEDLKRRYELWVRMLFSCLVDADFLDTERHFQEQQFRLRGHYLSLAQLKERFDKELERRFAQALPSKVNYIRNQVRAACQAKGRGCPQGVFTLNGPTGCGKTLASMAFALEHAARHQLERIIVVLPFTSIIDQNAKVYRDFFGAENVLEHHASIDLDDPTRENPASRVARENWDAPIIVTTSVQLLESLLANRTSRCRKLHNVARSVLIFDEVQTLPIAHLTPILDVLKELVRAYQVTLVLSTATQPALKHRSWGLGQVFLGFEKTTEIVEDVDRTFEALKRVEVKWPADLQQPKTWDELAKEVRQEEEVLVIVHKRDDARQLAELLPDSIHLSALMCPKHRLQVIERIKTELEANHMRRERKELTRPLRVVSTQLVEAGVDLDFPVVYRALAGLDAIAQAAGRCNREGRLDRLGQVRVFAAPTEPRKALCAMGRR